MAIYTRPAGLDSSVVMWYDSDTGQIVNENNIVGGATNGLYKSVQVFTTTGAGTWTKPAGISLIKVFVTGAGASGGRSSVNNSAGGGGAGGTAIKTFDVSNTASITLSIGTGGVGVNTLTTGNSGGSSTFDSASGPYRLVGGGGSGGPYAANDRGAPGGAGGTATGGDLNIPGDGGGLGGEYGWQGNGEGGSSYWGGAGRGSGGVNGGTHTGYAGSYGSGGSGSSNTTSGAGGDGIIVVEEYT